MTADRGIPGRDMDRNARSGPTSGWTQPPWPAGWTVHHIAETGSTNVDLLAAAERGDVGDRTVMATDHQTAGRGRLSRTWDAPSGTNLLTSFLFLDSELNPYQCTQLIGLAAIAAVEACAGRSLEGRLGLKWPNDVLLDGRKLAGVLALRSSQLDATVVGIGLNVNWAPEDAAAVRRDLDCEVAPPEVLRAMIAAIDSLVTQDLGQLYRARLLTLGQHVRVELPADRSVVGTAVDLDPDGRIVIDVEGERVPFDVGDVVHLRST